MMTIKRFLQKMVTPDEWRACLIILALAVITFILPNHTIDPWQLFNPQRFSMVILLIASIQFGGYMAIRLFGDKYGIAFSGFFGGLISSTAVFLNLPKIYHERKNRLHQTVSAAILATIGMLLEFFLIVYMISRTLSHILFLPISTMVIIGVLCASISFWKQGKQGYSELTHAKKPLDIRSVLILALFLFGMLIAIAIAIRVFGYRSAELTTFIGSFFELHSITLATTTLFVEKHLSLDKARFLLILALSGGFLSKILLIWFFARNRLAVLTTVFLCLMFLGGMSIYWIQ